MDASRSLIVVADDYGIGPETSRGILELAAEGIVTGTVLIVNSPFASDAVQAWRAAGEPVEMGWHPNLTMDPPCAPPNRVRTLIGPDGCLWPLGQFLTRLHLFRLSAEEIETELRAQYSRYLALVGRPPALVNSHQHVALFGPVGTALLRMLSGVRPRPYLRRVCEPWGLLRCVPGARVKRAILNWKGRRLARLQAQTGLWGADWLAGITDPPCVASPTFFTHWLARVPGRVVELACHPGYHDPTLIGRDSAGDDAFLQRRIDEMHLLRLPSFSEACNRAGFVRRPPSCVSTPARAYRVAS